MTRISSQSNTQLADIYRDFVIDRMSVDYPQFNFDQWLAMDVFDLSLDIESNYAHYMREYRLEFDIEMETMPNSLFNAIFILAENISADSDNDSEDYELAQRIIELIDYCG